MFTLAVILFGLVGLGRLPVNLLPDLSYPTLTLRTAYPGAAPLEIEQQLINRPLEEAVGTVRGVRTITSYARGRSIRYRSRVRLGVPIWIYAGIEVREKIDMVMLPLDVEKPVLLRFNPNLEPIMRLALASGDTTSPGALQEMRRYADDELKRQIESITGIAAVRIGGGYEDEVQVLIDQQRASQTEY